MKLANKIVLPLLVVITGVITSGCSGTGKPQRTYLDETRNLPARAEYPYQYQYSESWRGTERGGAAIRYPGYEHTLRVRMPSMIHPGSDMWHMTITPRSCSLQWQTQSMPMGRVARSHRPQHFAGKIPFSFLITHRTPVGLNTSVSKINTAQHLAIG